MAPPRWLLLAHQLPTRPSNARVKTWRRLQQVGAVPTRNSVYVLPNTEQCLEDFEWIRAAIVSLGGEATVFAADALDDDGGDDIVKAFRHARESDYRALKRDADKLLQAVDAKRGGPDANALGRTVRGLRDRLGEIEQIDFFDAGGRQAAAETIHAMERLMSNRPLQRARPSDGQLSTDPYQNRRWVTRPRPGVDRMASAWLIRRFIDPHAAFAFVKEAADGEVAFDMYAGEFSHDGSLCTFETLARRFGIRNAAVTGIAEIVHDLDMKETRYAPPEAPAVARMIDGLRAVHSDDHILLEQGIAMFEALARSFASTAGRPASIGRPGAKARKTRKRRSRKHSTKGGHS